MKILKSIIEDTDTWRGKIFDIFIQSLIVISLITFSLETLPNLSSESRSILRWIEVVTVSIFTLEYMLRFLVSSNRLGFIFSFFGIVDLFAILPFYISTGVDLRTIRLFRLFRILRVFKFARYNAAIRRFNKAVLIAKEEMILFGFMSIIVLYLASVGIWYFEKAAQPEAFASIFHSMWWAIATLTTVGYGDVYPITVGGKVFTGVVMIAGLGIIAVPPGLVATALRTARDLEREENEKA